MAIASILASMADWSTPSVLFCVLNLMIATIFLASNFKSPNNHKHHHHNHNIPSHELARSPSLLERVKSVNLSSFSFYATPDQSHDHYKLHSETTESNSLSQLSPPPSLLQRVKSIDFSFSSFHNSVPSESEQLGNSPTERTRTLSLLDRVKSIKLTSPFDSGYTESSKDEYSGINPDQDSVEDNNVTSGKLHHNKLADLSEKSGVTDRANKSPSKLRKSGSEKKVAASTKAAVRVHDEGVDAKADDFIKRFKQQLKLQRLDSLQRLREMLNRGT